MPKNPMDEAKEKFINKIIFNELFSPTLSSVFHFGSDGNKVIILNHKIRDRIRKSLRPELMKVDYDYLEKNTAKILSTLNKSLAKEKILGFNTISSVSNATIDEMKNKVQEIAGEHPQVSTAYEAPPMPTTPPPPPPPPAATAPTPPPRTKTSKELEQEAETAIFARATEIMLSGERDEAAAAFKWAYKKLSLEGHPDKGGDPEAFKAMGQAYEKLMDDGKNDPRPTTVQKLTELVATETGRRMNSQHTTARAAPAKASEEVRTR